MKPTVKRTTVRFETKKDLELVTRAAKSLRVSVNRFITDAAVDKMKSTLATITKTAADQTSSTSV